MNRRLLMLAVTVIATAGLSGCGSDASAIRCALVTGAGGTTGSAEIADLSSGIESYAADSASVTRIYTAAADTEEEYKVQFDAAAEDKAAYVVSDGVAMEKSVFDAQNAHRGQNFIFFDGKPRQAEDLEETIADNTECIEFDRGDMGFLAGYVAVTDGYRNIFYFSGERTEEKAEYYDGFLRGAAYAMKEQGLAEGSVAVTVEFAGSDALSPLRMTDAAKQFDAGAELVVTDTPAIATASLKAAELRQKNVATVGFDATAQSAYVIYSAVADRADLIKYLLTSFDENKENFAGGQTVLCGAGERAVRLSADYSRLRAVSEASMELILDSMAGGDAAGALPGAADGEEAAAVSLPSVNVTEVQPVTPDGEAGLGS